VAIVFVLFSLSFCWLVLLFVLFTVGSGVCFALGQDKIKKQDLPGLEPDYKDQNLGC
jgi:hypothetical protein